MPEVYPGAIEPRRVRSELHDCGCARARVSQSGHIRGCPQGLIVGSEDPGAFSPAGGVLKLSAMSTGGADWTRVEVIPEAAILRLDVVGYPGLWQRHGTQLVRIEEEEFAALVEWCDGRGCGVCAYCTEEKEEQARGMRRVLSMEALVGSAMGVAGKALEAYEQWDGGCDGQEFDLLSTDAADCLVDLQEAARSLRRAYRILHEHRVSMEGSLNRDG